MASVQTASLVFLELKRDLVLRDGGQGERKLHEPRGHGLRTWEGGHRPEAKMPVLTGPAILKAGCLVPFFMELCDLYVSTCYAHGRPEEGSYYYSLWRKTETSSDWSMVTQPCG